MPRPKRKIGPAGVMIVLGLIVLGWSLCQAFVDTGVFQFDSVFAWLGVTSVAVGLGVHLLGNKPAWRRFWQEYRLVLIFIGATAVALLVPHSVVRGLPILGSLPAWIARLALLFLIEVGFVLLQKLVDRARGRDGERAFSERASSLGNAVIVIQLSVGLLAAVNVIATTRLTRTLGVLDLTETRAYTLSDETKRILDELPTREGRLSATYFSFGSAGPLGELARDFLGGYEDYSPSFSVKTIDALRDLGGARDRFRELGLEDLDLENRDTVVFTYQLPGEAVARRRDVEIVRRTLVEQGLGTEKFRGEQFFTSAIREVLFPPKKIYFLTGHDEASITDTGPAGLSRAVELLERIALTAEPLSLTRRARVPEDAGALVIAASRSGLDPAEQSAIVRYLDAGGSLLLFTGPDWEMLRGGGTPRPIGLEDYLKRLGVVVRRDFLCKGYEAQFGTTSGVATAQVTDYLVTASYGYHPAVEELSKRQLPVKFFRACPVAVVKPARDDEAAVRSGELVNMMLSPPGIPNVTTYAARLAPGRDTNVPDVNQDLVGQRLHLVAAAEKLRRVGGATLSGDDEEVVTRVVVFGSMSFATNQGLGGSPIHYAPGNGVLLGNTISWAVSREALIAIDPKVWETDQVALEDRELRLALAVGVVALPVLVLLLGIGIAIIRRR